MRTLLSLTLAAIALSGAPASAQTAPPQTMKPQETEVWSPTPTKITPTKAAPSDAIVLFDGSSLGEWVNVKDGAPAGWTVADGMFTVNKPVGNIQTKRNFKNYQLHLEWRVPANITGTGQGRGNSGVFLASTGTGDAGYELQVLDSFDNPTYVNGQAGSIYKQHPPPVNASLPPGQWQTYDVIWTAPTFDAAGAVKTPARVTALHNGVLIQNDAVLAGETLFIGKPRYKAYDRAPIKLQAHGDKSEPVSFRNIWVRELP
jgi:hypothetical protein